MGASNSSEIKKAGIPPEKAFILFTEESWGCVYNQQTQEDVTNLVAYGDGKFVQVEEIKNPEDRANCYELYLYFSAKESSGLPGYYILRLGIKHQDPSIKGCLLVDQAKLIRMNESYFIELKAKVNGFLRVDLLYGNQTSLKTGFFSCPDSGLFEPYKISFLKAYEIKHFLRFESEMIDRKWNKIKISLYPFLLKEAALVNECEEFLDILDKEFSSSKDLIYVWNKSKVTLENVENIASALEQKKVLKYNFSLKSKYKKKTEELNRNGKQFVPNIRQRISVKESTSELVGGEVWIGVELIGK